MDADVGGVITLGVGAYEVLSLSFHPLRSEVCVVEAGAGGCELIEADAISGDILVRTPLVRRVRHVWHQLVGASKGRGGSCVLVLAYEGGDVEVWDSEIRVLKDRMPPTKKDEGRAVTSVTSHVISTTIIIYYIRGGSAIERAEVGSGKSMRVDLKAGLITSISPTVQAQSGFLAVGLVDGEVRLLDGNTLALVHSFAASGLDIKGLTSTMLRSRVASVGFHPRSTTSLATTLQSGVVLFWDTRRESADCVCMRARQHTQALVHGCFHPFLPLFITLSQDGALVIWPIAITSNRPLQVDSSSPRGRYSVYLLYWYKSTNNDAEGAAASGFQRWRLTI